MDRSIQEGETRGEQSNAPQGVDPMQVDIGRSLSTKRTGDKTEEKVHTA
jgi:hypothetical protein